MSIRKIEPNIFMYCGVFKNSYMANKYLTAISDNSR